MQLTSPHPSSRVRWWLDLVYHATQTVPAFLITADIVPREGECLRFHGRILGRDAVCEDKSSCKVHCMFFHQSGHRCVAMEYGLVAAAPLNTIPPSALMCGIRAAGENGDSRRSSQVPARSIQFGKRVNFPPSGNDVGAPLLRGRAFVWCSPPDEDRERECSVSVGSYAGRAKLFRLILHGGFDRKRVPNTPLLFAACPPP